MKENNTANLYDYFQKICFPEEKLCKRTILQICAVPHMGELRNLLSSWLDEAESLEKEDALYLQHVLLDQCLFAEVTFQEGTIVVGNGFFSEPSMTIRENDGKEKRYFGDERPSAFMNWLEAKDSKK